MPRGRCSNPALPSRRRPACSDPRRLPGTRGRGRQRAERRPPRPPPRLLLLPALLPAATQPPSPTAGPASAHLLQPPGPFGAASCWRSALPGTPRPAHRPPGQRWGAAGGPESLPCFSPNPLLPLPIQAHTNHVIVLCFRRQFLDSDMPRYYLFPLVFFPPPLCSFPLSPPHLSTLTPAGGSTWVSSPPLHVFLLSPHPGHLSLSHAAPSPRVLLFVWISISLLLALALAGLCSHRLVLVLFSPFHFAALRHPARDPWLRPPCSCPGPAWGGCWGPVLGAGLRGSACVSYAHPAAAEGAASTRAALLRA